MRFWCALHYTIVPMVRQNSDRIDESVCSSYAFSSMPPASKNSHGALVETVRVTDSTTSIFALIFVM